MTVSRCEGILVGIMCILSVVRLSEGLFFNSWYNQVTSFQENDNCNGNNSKFAIIVHGWRESCREDWVVDLKMNLQMFRGECIMCMDYELAASIPHYLMLANHVNYLATILKEKLMELEDRGYDPDNGYIFGFSLGARIAIRAGNMFGYQRLKEIDVCDMAGPGFDFFDGFDPTAAAQNVQCIHTSTDKGTMSRNCHQNWNMGVCGMYQIGAGVLPGTLKSHGLCPRFYNSAFVNNFYAEIVPEQCSLISAIPQLWPNGYKMGYMEQRKTQARGEMYAATLSKYPYTTNTNQITAWEIIQQLNGRFVIVVNRPNHFVIYFSN